MDPIFTFSKRIKDDQAVRVLSVTDPLDAGKLEQVIQRLEGLPRVTTANLQDIGLKTNPKKWVRALLKNHLADTQQVDIENLLSDFTDTMKTRMREESKYAIGILMKGRLLLCHSVFGEETITPDWKIIPRMLDADNILRFVMFADEKGVNIVKHWEKEATSSFIEWLGLPRKQAFQVGGAYRIYGEIDGVTVEFQLTEQELENWLNTHPEIKDGKIKFVSPIHLFNVQEIRVGRKRYSTTEDFIQDYEAEKFGAPKYQQEFQTIKKQSLPLLMKHYDEKTQVVRKEGDEETVVATKSTPTFEVLFVDADIELRASYLKELSSRFINGEALRIFHAGMKFRTPPYQLGSMIIHNQLALDAPTQWITQYCNQISLQDKALNIILKYVVLQMLGKANHQTPIAYFFEPLAREIIREVEVDGRLSKLEDTTVEYKAADFLSGNTSEVVNRIKEDMTKKLNGANCKIYLFGVEDSGIPNVIPASRLKSDRIESIRSNLEKDLKMTVMATPIVQDENGIMMVAIYK